MINSIITSIDANIQIISSFHIHGKDIQKEDGVLIDWNKKFVEIRVAVLKVVINFVNRTKRFKTDFGI